MGLKDIKKGRVISEEDLRKDASKWLAMKKKELQKNKIELKKEIDTF